MEAIGINLPGLLAQIVNFVLLLILLKMLVYQPVLGMLSERTRRIQESIDRAEQIRQEATRAQQEFQGQIEAARREGQQIINQANQIGERMKEEKRQEALKEAEALIVRARAEIELERDRAIAELRQHFGDLVVAAAGKIISQRLDKATHQKLIDEVLAQSVALRKS